MQKTTRALQRALVGNTGLAWLLSTTPAYAHGEQIVEVWISNAVVAVVSLMIVALAPGSRRLKVRLVCVLAAGLLATCASPLQSTEFSASYESVARAASFIPLALVMVAYVVLRRIEKRNTKWLAPP